MTKPPPVGVLFFLPGLVAGLAALIVLAPRTLGGAGPDGTAADLVLFWEAGRLALQGQAATLFDPAALADSLPPEASGLKWLYPPTMALVLAPLGALPLPVAGAILLTATLLGLLAALRIAARGAPQRSGTVLLGAFTSSSAYLIALGQLTGVFAALIVIGLTAARRRPVLAGVLIGLVTLKPHVGVLLPFALAGLRAWRAAAAAAATAMFLGAASLLVFGAEPWRLLAANLTAHQGGHGAGVAIGSMGGFQSLAKLGLPLGPAAAFYGVLCVGAAATAWRLGRVRPADLAPFVLLGTGLVCPVVWPYQWVLPTIGAVTLAARDAFGSPLLCAAAALVALGALPAIATGLTMLTLLPTGAALCLAVWLGVAAWRVTRRSEAPSEAFAAA